MDFHDKIKKGKSRKIRFLTGRNLSNAPTPMRRSLFPKFGKTQKKCLIKLKKP